MLEIFNLIKPLTINFAEAILKIFSFRKSLRKTVFMIGIFKKRKFQKRKKELRKKKKKKKDWKKLEKKIKVKIK